jgi:hypothetical protein
MTPMEEIVCKLGYWYEIGGVYVCCTDATIAGVRMRVSTTEPRAKVRRRRNPVPTAPPLLQLPPVTSLSGETRLPGEMTN